MSKNKNKKTIQLPPASMAPENLTQEQNQIVGDLLNDENSTDEEMADNWAEWLGYDRAELLRLIKIERPKAFADWMGFEIIWTDYKLEKGEK